jgi:hypothetical protein
VLPGNIEYWQQKSVVPEKDRQRGENLDKTNLNESMREKLAERESELN